MSFIQDFVEYNSGNECPRPFVIWTAYGLLSAAIGRRVFIDLDYFKVNCDTYILLVGPSGERKTATMILGRELILEAIPDIVLASDNETYQGIIQYMHNEKSTRFYKDAVGQQVEYKPYHVFSEELMDYLQLNPIGMVSFLTNIYGKRFYNYRLKNEEHLLANPYVTILACSTPEWLTDQIKGKQFAEGYGRRTIIVCHEGINRRKPILTEESKAAYKRCVERLTQIRNFAGPFIFPKDAHDFFWGWYTSLKSPADKFLRNWYSTLHLNLLKVAMLNSISERDDLTVVKDDLELALGLLKEVEKYVPMITSRIGRSELTEPSLHMLSIIRNSGGCIAKKELMAMTFKDYKSTQEQWSVLQHLKETDQVKEISSNDVTQLREKNKIARQFLILPDVLSINPNL